MKLNTIIHKNKKGVTLIELLVVIAIMGILASGTFVALASNYKKTQLETYRNIIEDYNNSIINVNRNLRNGIAHKYVKVGDTYEKKVIIPFGGDVTADKYIKLFENDIKDIHEIKVQNDNKYPRSMSPVSCDTIIYNIGGIGAVLDNEFKDKLVFYGAWYIPEGTKVPAVTYDNIKKEYYNEARDLKINS